MLSYKYKKHHGDNALSFRLIADARVCVSVCEATGAVFQWEHCTGCLQCFAVQCDSQHKAVFCELLTRSKKERG